MPVENDYPNLHDLANTTMESTKHELPPSLPDGEISPTNPAKRRRVSAESAINEQKKSRGRPRVEPDDGGSAADRRRTQIRLAQRAYRARAENKKSVLEVKSRKYEGIIDEMHGALARFHTAAVEGGLALLSPALAHQLHTTLQDFERLAADAKRDDDDMPDVQEKSHSSHDSNSPPKVFDSALGSSAGHMADAARPIPNSGTTSTESIPSASRPWTYQSSYENLPRPEAQMLPTHIPSHRGSYADPAGPAEDIHRLHMPANPSLARPDMLLQSPGSLEILSPLTYSFMETSFSRRLHRAALEKAAYLLSQPKIRDDLLRQMFRVSYRYLPLSEIRDQLQSRIAANSTEPLESFYDFPHNDFGGANTHFKRSGLSGSSIPPLQRITGPPRPKLLKEEDNPDRPAPDPADDPTGLNGEWFSPDDVQGYLFEIRGLEFGPMAQYVQADFAINSPTLSSRNQPNANAFAGEDLSQTAGAYQSVDMRDGTYLASRNQVDHTPHFNLINNVGVARMGGEPHQQHHQQQHTSHSHSPPTVEPLPAPSSRRSSRQKVTIDVERLIEELAGTAVCLGRFPGFRRTNVERALQLSIAAS